MTDKYILACDEHGNTSLSSSRRTFTIGGFIAKESSRSNIVRSWERIKLQLCGRKDVELKWSHFFPGPHQHSGNNPLLSKDSTEWRKQSLWALNEFFRTAPVFPLTTVVQKDRVALSLLKEGNNILDVAQIFIGTLGQFALYLKEYNGKKGEIWFDRLGSREEEERRTAAHKRFYDVLTQAQQVQSREFVLRIDPNLRFLDSQEEPFIQLADFVSGVIGAASEGDEWFLLQLREKYTFGREPTYGILILDA